MPLTPKQLEYKKLFSRKDILYLLYAGSVSCGKSIIQIGLMHKLCMEYPGTRHGIIRKNLSTMRKTSLSTFIKVLDLAGDSYQCSINYSSFSVKYLNGSEILFIEADVSKDPRLLKLSGTEFTTLLLEECDELSEAVFSIAITRVGRWRNAKYSIPPKIQFNCNPNKSWVKRLFYDPYKENLLKPPFYFFESTANDNPHNTPEYLKSLEELPPDEKQRLVYNNWDYSENPNLLIRYSWVKQCLTDVSFEDMFSPAITNKIYLGCDIARSEIDESKGMKHSKGDRTILCYMINNNILRFEEYNIRDVVKIADIIAEKSKLLNILPQNIAVDIDGIGAGTYDALKRFGIVAFPYDSRLSPSGISHQSTMYKFKNLRAQAHWELREDFKNLTIATINNIIFLEECTSVNYSTDSGYILIEAKDKFKTRMGYSPDYLDSAVMANYIRNHKNVFKCEDIILGPQLSSFDLFKS